MDQFVQKIMKNLKKIRLMNGHGNKNNFYIIHKKRFG